MVCRIGTCYGPWRSTGRYECRGNNPDLLICKQRVIYHHIGWCFEKFFASENCNTVVSRLARKDHVIARCFDFRFGKLVVNELGFLQPQRCRLGLLEPFEHVRQAHA